MTGPVLVLGGCGFLGSHLVRALVAEGHAVRVFDRPGAVPCLPPPSGVDYVGGDFGHPDQVAQALTGCHTVFHLLSTTLPKTSNDNPVLDLETNLVSTVRMLEAARKRGVAKVVFASSGGTIYGPPRQVPIPESHPTEPICSYGIGKLAIEKYLHLYHHLHGLSHCTLRIANPYGEGQRPHAQQGAIAVFSYHALHDELIEVWGDGSVVRDYLYVGDVAEAFIRAMHYQGTDAVFNIGSGRGYSINELLTALEAELGRPVRRAYLPGRSFDVPVNVLDIGRAVAELGWEPKTSLNVGLARTVAALRSLHEANRGS